jgi:hypothetical protein
MSAMTLKLRQAHSIMDERPQLVLITRNEQDPAKIAGVDCSSASGVAPAVMWETPSVPGLRETAVRLKSNAMECDHRSTSLIKKAAMMTLQNVRPQLSKNRLVFVMSGRSAPHILSIHLLSDCCMRCPHEEESGLSTN